MIQIIDGFKLNATVPIDSRFVVADSTERLAITYLYHGLRVWQLDTNIPYFWDGSQWVSELDNVVTGTGSNGFIPKVTNSDPLQIDDSIISENSGVIDINGDLTVEDISFSGTLTGDLNADNVISGSMSSERIKGGSVNQVLVTDASLKSVWKDSSSLTIGSAGSANQVNSISTVNGNNYNILFKSSGITLPNSVQVYSNSSLVVNDDGLYIQIRGNNGLVSRPTYSFSSGNSGMYLINGSSLRFSYNSNDKLSVDANGIKTILGTITNPSISSFGGKTVNTPTPFNITFSNMGFYYDAQWTGGSTGIIRELNFTDGFSDIVKLWSNGTDGGLVINKIGSALIPSLSFIDIDSGSNGIGIYTNVNRTILNISTGGKERFSISGDSNVPANQAIINLKGITTINSSGGNYINDDSDEYALTINQNKIGEAAGLFVNVTSTVDPDGNVPFLVRTGGVNRLLVRPNGITDIYTGVRMLNRELIKNFSDGTIFDITYLDYISESLTIITTNNGPFEFDVMITCSITYDSVDNIILQIESGLNTGFYDDILISPLNFSYIVPSGLRWRVKFERYSTGSFDMRFTSRKMGI